MSLSLLASAVSAVSNSSLSSSSSSPSSSTNTTSSSSSSPSLPAFKFLKYPSKPEEYLHYKEASPCQVCFQKTHSYLTVNKNEPKKITESTDRTILYSSISCAYKFCSSKAHIDCLNLGEVPTASNPWYCSPDCKAQRPHSPSEVYCKICPSRTGPLVPLSLYTKKKAHDNYSSHIHFACSWWCYLYQDDPRPPIYKSKLPNRVQGENLECSYCSTKSTTLMKCMYPGGCKTTYHVYCGADNKAFYGTQKFEKDTNLFLSLCSEHSSKEIQEKCWDILETDTEGQLSFVDKHPGFENPASLTCVSCKEKKNPGFFTELQIKKSLLDKAGGTIIDPKMKASGEAAYPTCRKCMIECGICGELKGKNFFLAQEWIMGRTYGSKIAVCGNQSTGCYKDKAEYEKFVKKRIIHIQSKKQKEQEEKKKTNSSIKRARSESSEDSSSSSDVEEITIPDLPSQQKKVKPNPVIIPTTYTSFSLVSPPPPISSLPLVPRTPVPNTNTTTSISLVPPPLPSPTTRTVSNNTAITTLPPPVTNNSLTNSSGTPPIITITRTNNNNPSTNSAPVNNTSSPPATSISTSSSSSSKDYQKVVSGKKVMNELETIFHSYEQDNNNLKEVILVLEKKNKELEQKNQEVLKQKENGEWKTKFEKAEKEKLEYKEKCENLEKEKEELEKSKAKLSAVIKQTTLDQQKLLNQLSSCS